jgi:general secretion pathway protein F/type IV pilus assembly protein PilC
MVRAGQEGGFLEDVLRRIAEFTEQQEELKSKVVGAMVYPVVLSLVGTAILFLLMIFVVPKLSPILKKQEQAGELPFISVLVLGTSKFLLTYWWAVVLGVCAVVAAYKAWANSADGRRVIDRWKIAVPLSGKIYLNLAVARFCRILGTLLHNGIPILTALRIAKDSTGNKVLSQAIEDSAENLRAGESLAKPLAASGYFPRDVVEIVAVGEESNTLERVLVETSHSLEKRTTRQLELFVKLLEPMLLLVMAGLVLVIVMGLLLPVFNMSSVVKK